MTRQRQVHLVLMSGDRNGYPGGIIRKDIRRLKKAHGEDGVVVMAGGAPGVDTQVRLICDEENVHHLRVNALWSTRHKGAGPQRNTIMLKMMPDEVFAYHESIKESRGTKDCVKQALKMSIPVHPRGFIIENGKLL